MVRPICVGSATTICAYAFWGKPIVPIATIFTNKKSGSMMPSTNRWNGDCWRILLSCRCWRWSAYSLAAIYLFNCLLIHLHECGIINAFQHFFAKNSIKDSPSLQNHGWIAFWTSARNGKFLLKVKSYTSARPFVKMTIKDNTNLAAWEM